MEKTDWGANWVLFWWVGRAQQIFKRIFCWWVELCSLPAIYLGPNFGGGNEDNGYLLQSIPWMYLYTHCPQPCSKPPPTHASAGDSWTLSGNSGSVFFGVTSPFFWVLVYTRFCLCPPRVYPRCILVVLEIQWCHNLHMWHNHQLKSTKSKLTGY